MTILNFMKKPIIAFLSILLFLISCKKKNIPAPVPPVQTSIYFPPLTGSAWQTISAASLGWNETLLNDLAAFLQQKNSKAFIILKNGKIVSELYFGSFTKDSAWYWASAGKTLTAMLVGIAQKEGSLNIANKTSAYLGNGWTALPQAKEDLITIRHQLMMNTGLDDDVPDVDCTTPSCLVYKSDAGSRWSYHNAPYTLLEKVVENATSATYNNYFTQKIGTTTGMSGVWIKLGFNNVFFSNARSMARYGLLLLNKGKWSQTAVLNDSVYFNNMISSSQNFNQSYGYLTWLNGKSMHMLPQSQFVFNGPLVPQAPADMYAALGKNDQKIYVVPSQNLVVIRMGESAGNIQMATSSFDNELWGKLKPIIGY